MRHTKVTLVVALDFVSNPLAVLLLAACRTAKLDRLLARPVK